MQVRDIYSDLSTAEAEAAETNHKLQMEIKDHQVGTIIMSLKLYTVVADV